MKAKKYVIKISPYADLAATEKAIADVGFAVEMKLPRFRVLIGEGTPQVIEAVKKLEGITSVRAEAFYKGS